MQLLLSFIVCFGILEASHPFHVSVSEVHFNPSAQTLEITHKIFLDDLENALKRRSKEGVDLLNISDQQKIDQMIAAYIGENFILKTDHKGRTADYLGKEIEADAMWIYMEVRQVPELENIQVRNTLLFELFKDQINLVHVEKGEKIRSLKLTQEKKQGSIRFKQ